MTQNNRCILADSQGVPLAHALLESPADAAIWQLRVLDGGINAVLEHEYLDLVGVSSAVPPVSGRIVRHMGDVISLEPISKLNEKIRENLRVPFRYESYLYPVSGDWKGRRKITFHDLSCGGAALFCGDTLELGEVFEVAVPAAEPPLLVRAKVLRQRPSNSPTPLYACEFAGLAREEDTFLRETVFSQQLLNHEQTVHSTVS